MSEKSSRQGSILLRHSPDMVARQKRALSLPDDVAPVPLKQPPKEIDKLHLPLLRAYNRDRDFTTIDFLQDAHRHRVMLVQQRARNKGKGIRGKLIQSFNHSQAWLILTIVSAATAVSSAVMFFTIEWLSGVQQGYCSHGFFVTIDRCCLEAVSGKSCPAWITWSNAAFKRDFAWFNFPIYVLSASLFAGLAAWLVNTFAPKSAGPGIPEVKVVLGGFIMKQVLGGWNLLLKIIGLILAESSGLSMGFRGPLVHVAACWTNIFSRMFPKYINNEGKKREVLSAAVAAGIAAGFGAPLGGVLFSLETLSSYFPHKTIWRSFYCAVITTLIVKSLYSLPSGKAAPLQIIAQNEFQWFELVPFVVVGALGGAIGAMFTRLTFWVQALRSSYWKGHPIVEVAIIAGITGVVSYFSVFLKANLSDLISSLFENCVNLNPSIPLNAHLCSQENQEKLAGFLILVALIKFLTGAVTFGLQIPTGMLMPLISVGACIGRSIGLMTKVWQESDRDFFFFAECDSNAQCIFPGIYAVVGAGAVLSGSLRLTGSLNYVIPIVLGILASKGVADLVGTPYGLFDYAIIKRKIPYIPFTAETDCMSTAASIMTWNPVTLSCFTETVRSVEQLLEAYSYSGFPVVESAQHSKVFIGFVLRADLHRAVLEARQRGADSFTRCIFASSKAPFHLPDSSIDMTGYVNLNPVKVDPETPLDILLDMFKALGLGYVIVCKDGLLQGLVKKKDVAEMLSSTIASHAVLRTSHEYSALLQEESEHK